MKSRITVFCLLFLSLSQLSSRAQAFEKSSSLLTVSLGAASMIHIPIGDYRGYYYRSSYTAITGFIRAEFEKGVHKYVGVGGFVDLGGRGGPRNYYYDYYGNYYYSGGYYPSFNISAGAVANFHFYQLIQDKVKKNIHADKLDIYTGVNFGVGIAIHPSDMKTGDYARVVGVAWESSKGDGVIHFVNVAVGINTNRLSKKVDLLNRRVENILAHLEGKAPLLDDTTLAKEEYSLPPQVKPKTNISKVYTDEQFAELLDRHEPFVRNLFILIKKEVIKKGGNPDAPYLRRLFEDPVQFLKAMRSDPSLYTPWAAFDQGLPVQSKK